MKLELSLKQKVANYARSVLFQGNSPEQPEQDRAQKAGTGQRS